ncbi:MAG: hypothetical protein COB53_02075 [Elusimicrobia bacterium]|nr:MAG: hypothetical protein COB53_02075 [Elusimicrobiota bacterium]
MVDAHIAFNFTNKKPKLQKQFGQYSLFLNQTVNLISDRTMPSSRRAKGLDTYFRVAMVHFNGIAKTMDKEISTLEGCVLWHILLMECGDIPESIPYGVRAQSKINDHAEQPLRSPRHLKESNNAGNRARALKL